MVVMRPKYDTQRSFTYWGTGSSQTRVGLLLRLFRKALLLFGVYATVLAAVVVAGFLGGAIGIWASILWGVGILVGLALYARRRVVRRRLDPHQASTPPGGR